MKKQKCWCCKQEIDKCDCNPMLICQACQHCQGHCECVQLAELPGVGPEAPTVINQNGGKQSHSPYRCDLIPPRAALEVAQVLAPGADKYGVDNWRLINQKDHINHALMHLFAHMAGDKQDQHLAHAACRILFALET